VRFATARLSGWVSTKTGSGAILLKSERSQVGPEFGPTSAFFSCIPAGMHGPTCIFWANLTRFSLQGCGWQRSDRGDVRVGLRVGDRGERRRRRGYDDGGLQVDEGDSAREVLRVVRGRGPRVHGRAANSRGPGTHRGPGGPQGVLDRTP
jgi:hypothetical protein